LYPTATAELSLSKMTRLYIVRIFLSLYSVVSPGYASPSLYPASIVQGLKQGGVPQKHSCSSLIHVVPSSGDRKIIPHWNPYPPHISAIFSVGCRLIWMSHGSK
jgi:hypothetical protein